MKSQENKTKSKKVTAKNQAKTKPKGGKISDRAEAMKALAEQLSKVSTKDLRVLKNSLPGLFEDDEQPEQAETKDTIDISVLAKQIKEETYDSIAMAYALLRMVGPGQNPELHRQIIANLYSALDGIPEGKRPLHSDLEADIAPVRKWFALLCGFEAGSLLIRHSTDRTEQVQDNQQEKPELDELSFIKEWIAGLSYKEKLAIALSYQLLNKEHVYKLRKIFDGDIGNDLLRMCENTVIDAINSSGYLKSADSKEAALSAFTTALLPMEV